MTPAKNLQLFPEKAEKASVRPYTKLDDGRDLDPLYDLPNALVKPALFLMSRRRLRMPGANWADVASKIKRSQPQTTEALTRLAALGLAECRGGLWFWKSSGNPAETRRKSYMAAPENDVQDGSEQAPEYKELKEHKEQEEQASDSSEAASRAAGRAVDTTAQDAGAEEQAPGGATPTGVNVATPSQDQFNNDHQDGGNDIVTGSEQVPPAPAVTPAAARRVIREAGLSESWRSWVRLTAIRPVTQEVQSVIWATWIQQGHGALLGEQVAHIVTAGTYGSPMAALSKRMGDGMKPTAPAASAAPTRPSFVAGQRVRYPDGSVATVLAVLSRGIATDHPEYPDVPLAQIRGLQVVE